MLGLPGKRSSKFDSETSVYERNGSDSEGSHLFEATGVSVNIRTTAEILWNLWTDANAFPGWNSKWVSPMAGAAPESPITLGQRRRGSREG
jgi:hypothetical protein